MTDDNLVYTSHLSIHNLNRYDSDTEDDNNTDERKLSGEKGGKYYNTINSAYDGEVAKDPRIVSLGRGQSRASSRASSGRGSPFTGEGTGAVPGQPG